MDEKETTDKEPTENTQDPPLPKSYILVEFEHPGTSQPAVQSANVTPQQVVIAAKTLDMMAEDEIRARWQQLKMEEMQKQSELMRMQMQLKAEKKPSPKSGPQERRRRQRGSH